MTISIDRFPALHTTGLVFVSAAGLIGDTYSWTQASGADHSSLCKYLTGIETIFAQRLNSATDISVAIGH